jgi:hypothetical protein
MAVSLVSTGVTFPDSSTQITAATGFGFKNRIINGAMVIDQRNAGASVTPTTGQYLVDRFYARLTQASKFSVQQNAGSVTPPTGFSNYLGVTSLSAYSVISTDVFGIRQAIEGFNSADLAWGTASAATVTLSFWVRSSLTGTFGGAISNDAAGNYNYPFSYTISAANTWEQKSITITGPTSGTWPTNSSGSIQLNFGLGAGATFSGTAGAWVASNIQNVTGATSVVGTNGATFYITGVQLEKGSTATSFDYRPYGTELALCQRYYYRLGTSNYISAFNATTSRADGSLFFPVTMRAAPTALEQTGTAGDYRVIYQGTGAVCTSVPTFSSATVNGSYIRFNNAAVFTVGQACFLETQAATAYLGWSAEL